VDVLVVGPEADRLVDVLAALLAQTSPSVDLRAPGVLASSVRVAVSTPHLLYSLA
jgi:hypothetical protein